MLNGAHTNYSICNILLSSSLSGKHWKAKTQIFDKHSNSKHAYYCANRKTTRKY